MVSILEYISTIIKENSKLVNNVFLINNFDGVLTRICNIAKQTPFECTRRSLWFGMHKKIALEPYLRIQLLSTSQNKSKLMIQVSNHRLPTLIKIEKITIYSIKKRKYFYLRVIVSN